MGVTSKIWSGLFARSGENQDERHRKEPGYADCDAGKCAFGFAEADRLRGADRMACGADGKAGGDRMLKAEQPDEERRGDCAEHPGGDQRRGRD